LVAQIFAWVEQHQKVRELSGRPNVSLRISHDGSSFMIRTSDSVAVDLTIDDIAISKPVRHMLWVKEFAASVVGSENVPKVELPHHWIVKFETLQDLHKDDIATLPYRIPGSGKDINNVLCQLIGSDTFCFPLTLMFSNLGAPKRSWHSHYVLNYNSQSKGLYVTHIDIGEVKQGKGTCSCCSKHGNAGQPNDLLD
jgi:uncharacterized protein YukJ